MIEGMVNFDNKLKTNNVNIIRPKTEINKKVILENKQKNNINNNKNLIQKSNINNIQQNNNIPIKNNINIQKSKINKNVGKIQKIKKIVQNFGNYNKNVNINNEYNYNIFERLDKQYTPILKNENDIFKFFNYNIKPNHIKYMNLKKENNNNNIENPNNHKRAKSTNKPYIIVEKIKNKKASIKLYNNYKSNGKNYPHLINKNENIKSNSPKETNNNIKVINMSPNKKVFSLVKNNINKNQDEKAVLNKNTFKSINNNIYDKNFQISKEYNNINKQITIKTQPYVSYAISDHPNHDYRKEMEDFHNFKNLSFPNIVYTYFSIFDGHGGAQVSSFLRDNFHLFLLEELKSISFTNNTETNNKKIISSINNAFEKIDSSIIDNKNFKNDNGSTGTIILLYRDPNNLFKRYIICANVGDSKGYIINKNKVKKITTDHICSDSNEVSRIKNRGGFVFNGRVFGVLMLTRSFGDKEFKQYGLLATPSIYCNLIEDNDLYAVIASDGVWDTISEENLLELSKEKMPSDVFSKKIVVTSLEKGTQDNISCFVIKLNST